MKKAVSSITILLALMVLVTGCKPDENINLASLGQTNINSVTKNSAIISGAITNEGGGTIINCGVYISTSGEPSSADMVVYSSNYEGVGSFDCNIEGLTPNTDYRVKIFATNEAGTALGLTATFRTSTDPIILSTKEVADIRINSLVSGGNIIDAGDNIITEYGLVLSKTSTPTIDDIKVVYGNSEADYSCSVNSLEANTTYYLRAYATNDKGESYYGEEQTAWTYALEDQDGNFYHAVTIGQQTWTVENFKATHYLNGDEITEVTDDLSWSELTTGARCYYNNDRASYEPVYGCLYNWYAANDPRGLAPAGWRLPTVDEVVDMAHYLGGNDIAGGKMKEAGTQHWLAPNSGATNSSGFTALPGGNRGDTRDGDLGIFIDIKTDAAFWTGEEYAPNIGWRFYISYNFTQLVYGVASNKSYGNNLRFIKIEE